MIEFLRASHMKLFTYPSQIMSFYEFIKVDDSEKVTSFISEHNHGTDNH